MSSEIISQQDNKYRIYKYNTTIKYKIKDGTIKTINKITQQKHKISNNSKGRKKNIAVKYRKILCDNSKCMDRVAVQLLAEKYNIENYETLKEMTLRKKICDYYKKLDENNLLQLMKDYEIELID